MFGRQPNPVFTDAYRHVREVLQSARRASGISQRALAKRIGKSASHVSMIETGQRRVDVLEFHRIAASLGVDPVQLFRDATTGEPSSLEPTTDGAQAQPESPDQGLAPMSERPSVCDGPKRATRS